MHYTFEHAQGYLRADLFGWQTVEETLLFIDALAAEARKASATRIVIWVRNSRPIFKVDQYRVSERFKQLAAREELRASQQYIEVLAAQQGARLRAFRDEARALAWLRSVSPAQSQE